MDGSDGSCSGDCQHCPVAPSTGDGPYQGRALAWRAAAFFLAPIIVAVAGSIVAGPDVVWRWFGGSSGLLVGAVIAVLVARRAGRENGDAVAD